MKQHSFSCYNLIPVPDSSTLSSSGPCCSPFLHCPRSHWGPPQIFPCRTSNIAWQLRFHYLSQRNVSFLFPWSLKSLFAFVQPCVLDQTSWKIILGDTLPLVSPPHVLFEQVKNKGNLKTEGKFPEGQHVAEGEWKAVPDAGTCWGQSRAHWNVHGGEQRKQRVSDQKTGLPFSVLLLIPAILGSFLNSVWWWGECHFS